MLPGEICAAVGCRLETTTGRDVENGLLVIEGDELRGLHGCGADLRIRRRWD
jgi:hypothetical protein